MDKKLNYRNDAALIIDVKRNREAVGKLIYFTVCARPDLNFVVSELLQYFTEPNEQQWGPVLRYLKVASNIKLFYRKSSKIPGVQTYSDANCTADVNA